MASVVPSRETTPARRRAVVWRQWRRRVARWANAGDFYPRLELGLALLALLMGIASYAVLTGKRAPAVGFDPPLIAALLLANLVPLIALLVLIARRVAILVSNRRQGIAGAQLHVRLVALFASMAAVPTILVVVFAALLFQFGVQFWFSDRAKTVLDNADRVAQAYVEENKSRILDDIIALGRDVRGYAVDYGVGSASFRDGLAFQVAARNLSEAAVFRATPTRLELIAQVSLDMQPFEARMRALDLSGARVGEAQVVASARDRVEAVVRLDPTAPVYVYVSRRVEPRVLEQVARTQTALSDYKALTERSRALQWRFALVLIVVSLLIVAASIWFALWLANRLVAPIGRLAQAAERVGAGDFEVRVPVKGMNDEIGVLARAFNRMTGQIKAQQNALVGANTQSDNRRRFIEAVLAGVSAGVLSIDHEGIIRLANQSAATLLQKDVATLVGAPLADAVPELAGMLDTAHSAGLAAGEVVIARGSETQTLAVRLTGNVGSAQNYILTFDDISQQLADQRRAAWSDVARRIAHEIKNPLTPIQLSAERLQRRYGRQIVEDPETFAGLTDTIVRQVGDLRRMVDEFSSFARAPRPQFREESVGEIARQTLFLAEVAAPHVRFWLEVDEPLPPFVCDRRQIGQALANLVKNATESIGTTAEERGMVSVHVSGDRAQLCIEVRDNGPGIPAELHDRITEPYVTTRARGTGLGLAIVKRIVEDHGGQLTLLNRPEGGAIARMQFDLHSPVVPHTPQTAGADA
ncbi:sensor histidine kinase NtrY-like [Sandaracinobacteroides saxicola]|uniref:histidine kinase n=1 Tax=Sandaracinobacteroides saxicola TaxID=2759707 RepID=A0A7G5ILP6_9SPHN|nr:PAS domain-containing sensor histidine kinase [Sandaracinobacteroides saxicola]QMW24288.1 PAS domain-containing sensor histidine kinase [Sandaracinobacteroides saxicola]